MKKGNSETKGKFEDYLNTVEKTIAELEEGNLDLETSLEKYETGIKALKKSYEILEAMEKKIEILIKDERGKFHLQPFKLKKTTENK